MDEKKAYDEEVAKHFNPEDTIPKNVVLPIQKPSQSPEKDKKDKKEKKDKKDKSEKKDKKSSRSKSKSK